MAIPGLYVPITAEDHILEKNGNYFQSVLKAALHKVKCYERSNHQ